MLPSKEQQASLSTGQLPVQGQAAEASGGPRLPDSSMWQLLTAEDGAPGDRVMGNGVPQEVEERAIFPVGSRE